MTIEITVEAAGLSSIASGFILTSNREPVWMNVLVDDEQSISVVIFIHSNQQASGNAMECRTSEDGKLDEWHIYEASDADLDYTSDPIPVVSYGYGTDNEDMDSVKNIYLQISVTKLPASPYYRLEYVWLEGDSNRLPLGIC